MLKLIKDTRDEIAILITLSGGFWYLLEPPVAGASGVLSGLVGAFALAVSLGVRAVLQHWGQQARVRIVVLVMAVASLTAAVPTSVMYIVARSNLVFPHKQGGRTVEVVRGTVYRPGVEEVKLAEAMTDSDLLKTARGQAGRESIWTPQSISAAELRLTAGYVLTLLLTLMSTIFVVEVLRNRQSKMGLWRGDASSSP